MFEYYDGFLGRRNSIPVNPDDLIRLRIQGLNWFEVAKQVRHIDGRVGISHNFLSQANRVRKSHEWRVALDDYWRHHYGYAPPPLHMKKVLSYPPVSNSERHQLPEPDPSQETQPEIFAGDTQSDDDFQEDPESGLEVEAEDPKLKIVHPFNPEKIRVRTTNTTVELLVSRIRHNEIDLEPEFQRSFVWTRKQQCRLIESLLLRIPIPVFYVAADEKENWSVVDGVQRMFTIFNYVTDEYSLNRLEYLDRFNGKRYSELPRPMQRRIGETELVVNIVEPGTPEDVMFNIFRRINTGGMTLNGQEIRNALHPGPVRDYLKQLANSEAFLKATDYSIKKERMADRECVLRFLAFYIDSWKGYDANDLDGYLSQTMAKINAMTLAEREALIEDFKKAMRAAYDIFGDEAFRKRSDQMNLRRCPVSKALFEVWSVELARRSRQEVDRLVEKREDVIDRFIALMNRDSDFDRAISYSTGDPLRVKKRFEAITQLVTEVL